MYDKKIIGGDNQSTKILILTARPYFFLWHLLGIMLGLLCLFAFLINLRNIGGPDYIRINILSFSGLILFIGCFWNLKRSNNKKYPKLILDEQGVTFVSAFRRQFWNWNDVGSFSLSTRLNNYIYHYACAFTNERHTLMSAHNQWLTPTCVNADVIFGIDRFMKKATGNSAPEIVDILNEWRETYRNPQFEINKTERAENAESLAWDLHKAVFKKNAKYITYIITIFILILSSDAIYRFFVQWF